MSKIGKQIKKYRKQKKMTQAELAKKLSVNHSFISKIETGRKQPSIEQLKRISKSLSIPPSLLLEESPLLSTLRELTDRFDYDEILSGLKKIIAESNKRQQNN